MFKILTLLFFGLICATHLYAQKASIQGIVIDSIENKPLKNSAISLINKKDSILVKTLRSDKLGSFLLDKIPAGNYYLIATYPRMADYFKEITLNDTSKINLGKLHMESRAVLLQEVSIKAKKEAIRMRGDTLVFQADSFKVAPYANIEDLLKRLPGIEVDKDGNIKAQGKNVNTVLVDGEEFFGDDPKMVTKYLKAKAVDEIQVYDKKSKTAEQTGVDDGEKNKTINVKLKDNAKNGYILNADANEGSGRYKNYGALSAIYQKKVRALVYGLNSTLNQNTSTMKAINNTKRVDYQRIEMSDDGSTTFVSNSYRGSNIFNKTNGLPELTSYGAYFSDKWNDNKQKLILDYNNNLLNNFNESNNTSKTLLPNGEQFNNSSKSTNQLDARTQKLSNQFNFQLDSLSSIQINFDFNQEKNKSNNFSNGLSLNGQNILINKIDGKNTSAKKNENYVGNINYLKKFKKRGRSLTLNFQPEQSKNNEINTNSNIVLNYDSLGTVTRNTQQNYLNLINNKATTYAGSADFTEPLGKNWLLKFRYVFKGADAQNSNLVYDQNNQNAKIDSLSTNFKFNNFSNLGNITLQYRNEKMTINGGLEATRTSLSLKDLEQQININRNFINWAPRGNLMYNLGKSGMLNLSYTGRTNQPTIDQIQPLRRVASLLYEQVGNKNLKPSFSNSLSLNFYKYLQKSKINIGTYFSYSTILNAIVSQQTIDNNNKTIATFTNLNGNKNYYGTFYLSKSLKDYKTTFSLNASIDGGLSKSIINNTINKNTSQNINIETVFRHYGDFFDYSYNPSFSFTKNVSSIGTIGNGKNFNHNHEISGTAKLPYDTQFNTTISLTYQPANDLFPRAVNVAIWNCYLSKLMLRNKALEAKVSVSDILKGRNGYNRYVGGNNTYESFTTFIPRYLLFSLIYNVNGNFISNKK